MRPLLRYQDWDREPEEAWVCIKSEKNWKEKIEEASTESERQRLPNEAALRRGQPVF